MHMKYRYVYPKLNNWTIRPNCVSLNKIGAKTNISNHYDMFASNYENPNLFSENINGGIVHEFNKECEIWHFVGPNITHAVII